jgi:uncharacterized damage-inducible protein DinB
MAIAETILPEFDHETAITRTLLERVPQERADWRPHAKSMPLGTLAMHISNISFHWARIALREKEFDTNPPGGQAVKTPSFESTSQLLHVYDEGVRAARSLLVATSDAEFMVQWTLKNGGRAMFSLPRVGVFRSLVLNHAVHHRGQLSVYLRLLDVPVPSIYGPTADTQ